MSLGEPIRCVLCACTIESDAKDPCIQCQRVSVIIGTNYCPLCNAPKDSERLLPSAIDHLHARELQETKILNVCAEYVGRML